MKNIINKESLKSTLCNQISLAPQRKWGLYAMVLIIAIAIVFTLASKYRFLSMLQLNLSVYPDSVAFNHSIVDSMIAVINLGIITCIAAWHKSEDN